MLTFILVVMAVVCFMLRDKFKEMKNYYDLRKICVLAAFMILGSMWTVAIMTYVVTKDTPEKLKQSEERYEQYAKERKDFINNFSYDPQIDDEEKIEEFITQYNLYTAAMTDIQEEIARCENVLNRKTEQITAFLLYFGGWQ